MSGQTTTGDVARVITAWGRIETQMRVHAPASAALLRPPASAAEIAAAEIAIGRAPALKTLYQLHDGAFGSHSDDFENDHEATPPVAAKEWMAAGFLPGNQVWYRLNEMRAQYLHQTLDLGRDPGCLPISNAPGDSWFGRFVGVEEGEPTYGNLGKWAVDDSNSMIPYMTDGWPLPDYLEETAAAVEQGRCLTQPYGCGADTDEHPCLMEGGLGWFNPDEAAGGGWQPVPRAR
ncbi:SMI1/KNR4 family protein [Streptomyces niveus]|uniref:SMI1/KNR4 family protein n=1 Tax=Streptomyces niveus TaxID=193462 RepID=UPI00341F0462